jgi:7-cyano-7-deazaguanine synthase
MKSVVLLSSGLDSTVNLYRALDESQVVLALTFDYGQRAAIKEIAAAQKISNRLSVPHKVVSLPWFREFTKTSLVNGDMQVPTNQQVAIADLAISEVTAKAVWVPNRNGIFINIAAAFAEALGAGWIIPGFNLEEAATFPDNSEDFLQAASGSLEYSTANHVKVKCFTTALDKKQIVALGRTLKVPFDMIWPCYFGGEAPCGQCESCLRFQRAMS